MNLKPAGIKTVREAIERLMNGEIFYSPEGWEIVYDEVNIECSGDRYGPFKVRGNGRSKAVNYLWEKVSDWQIECKWEDDIGDGVLCWVSNFAIVPGNGNRLRLIVKYYAGEHYPYETDEQCWYKYAIPLTSEELKRYSRK